MAEHVNLDRRGRLPCCAGRTGSVGSGLEERAAAHLLNFFVGEFLESHLAWCVGGESGRALVSVELFRPGYQLTDRDPIHLIGWPPYSAYRGNRTCK